MRAEKASKRPSKQAFAIPSTTKYVRYVLMDVVGFSANRTVEAQSEIIAVLNALVQKATRSLIPARNKVIFIPTGDGICVAIVDPLLPYDIHIQLATDILQRLYSHNESITESMRKFQIRIGINENADNLITDINGSRNVAGAGINSTQRLMTFADGGQILVGQTVFDTLTHREAYHGAFRSYRAVAKHSLDLPIHQLTRANAPWLNCTPPTLLAPPAKIVPRLSVQEAYLFAHAIRNQEFFRSLNPRGQTAAATTVLLYFLGKDSEELAEQRPGDVPLFHTFGFGKVSISGQLNYYMKADFQLCYSLATFIWNELSHLEQYIEGSHRFICFINERGREKLKAEHPKIWSEMKLSDI